MVRPHATLGYHPKDLLPLQPKIIQILLELLSDMGPPIVSTTFINPRVSSKTSRSNFGATSWVPRLHFSNGTTAFKAHRNTSRCPKLPATNFQPGRQS